MSRTENYLNGQAQAEGQRFDENPNAGFGVDTGDLPLSNEEMTEQAQPKEKKYTFSQKTLERLNDLPKETLAKAGVHIDDYQDTDRKNGKTFTRRGLITRAEQQGGLFAKAVEHLAWGQWTDVPLPVNVFQDVLNREIPTTALLRLDGRSGMIADFRIQNPNVERMTVNEDVILNMKMRYFDDHGAVMELADRDKLALYFQGGVGRLPGSSGAFVIHPADPSIIMKSSPEATANFLLSRANAEGNVDGVYFARGEKHQFTFNASEAKRFASGQDVYVKNEQGEQKTLRYNMYTGYFVPSVTDKYALDKADKFLKEREMKRAGGQRQGQQRQQERDQAEGRSQKMH